MTQLYYQVKYSIALAMVIVVTSCATQGQERLSYPATPTQVSSKSYHGEEITDKFAWLANATSDSTKSWAKSQDALMKQYVESFGMYEQLKGKVQQLLAVSGRSELPMQAAGKYVYLKNFEGRNWDLFMKDDSEERRLFGAEPPFNPRAVRFFLPSPDGSKIALALATGSFDWKVMDAETGELSEATMRGRELEGTRLAWSQDSKSFYYIGNTKEEEGKRSGFVVKRHVVGEAADSDKIIFTPNSDGSKIELNVCRGGDYLIIAEREGSATQAKIHYLRTKTDELVSLIDEAYASFIFLGNDGDNFYFQTDADAPKGKVVQININRPSKSAWKELVPEGEKPVMGYQSAGGTFLPVMADNKFVIPTQNDLEQYLQVYSKTGQFLREIKLPSGGLYFNTNGMNGISSNIESPVVLIRFIGLTEPNTIFQIDVNSGEVIPFSRATTNFDASQYMSEIVFATSKDGTRVPISITRKKDIAKNGKAPLMMQVYGAMAFTNYPYFQGDFIAWLEMGGIHAVAHVRGGGAFGSGWHQAGIGRKKQNGIDDYIAALQYVIDEGYTSAERQVVNGGSAGTILAAAALVQRPDLIGGAVLHYGMLDMVGYAERFSSDANHAYMIPDLGTASVKEDFDVLKKYSPYQNLKSATCYPPVLALTSEVDTPLDTDSYRFIAGLQNSNEECSNPHLLQMAWGSHHSTFGSRQHSPVLTFADELAFLILALNIDVEDWLK